jgi:hypothetical protein
LQRGRVNISGFVCFWQIHPRSDVTTTSSSRLP